MTYERRIVSGILAETIKEFKVCTIQSTISNSAHYDYGEQVDTINYSKELVDSVCNPKRDLSSDQKVATYATNGNFPHKLWRS